MKTNIFQALLLGLAISLLGQTESRATDERLPELGARIRVTAPSLKPGWHIGMLNRLRIEPVCYTILIYGLQDKNQVTAMLPLEEIVQLQVSSLFGDGRGTYDPSKLIYPREAWLDVSLDKLRSASKCRK